LADIHKYDAIIIGGGPAGLTAGLYLARARIKTLLLEKLLTGGQMAISEWVENYPGFPEGIGGAELSENFRQQAIRFGLEIKQDEAVSIAGKHIKTAGGTEYEALGIIIASGAAPKKLNIPGEEALLGRGVSYCATCDGPLFKDKEVVVIGGGDTAVQEAIFLTKFCRKVYLVHRRDRLRATKVLQEKAQALGQKIEFVWQSVAVEIKGSAKVESVLLKNIDTGKQKELKCDGVFIFAGIEPNSGFAKGLVKLDKQGYIISDENMKTGTDGIYACGDVRSKLLRQVVTACGEAATAAFACQHYIEELKGIAYK